MADLQAVIEATPEHPDPRNLRLPDGRVRQFGLLIRAIGFAILPIDVLEVIVGIGFGEPRAVVLGIGSSVFGVWLLKLSRRPERLGLESTITRLAIATLALIAAAAVLEPAVSTAMAIAALLPAVLVMPFLSSRGVGRILAAAALVGIGSVVAGLVVPRTDRLPAEATGALAFATAAGLCLSDALPLGGQPAAEGDDRRPPIHRRMSRTSPTRWTRSWSATGLPATSPRRSG
jgi:hypothetical protein